MSHCSRIHGLARQARRSATDWGERNNLMQIPKRTTAELQPLVVNFNPQYKKFVERVTEQAIQDETVRDVTNREGLMNLHSLSWNQFATSAYRDMIRHSWHNTDPDYSTSELMTGPPVRMVQDIQFNFDPSSRCEYGSNHAFNRCSHCGNLMCLKHFLKRKCFHTQNSSLSSSNSTNTEDHDQSTSHD